MQNTHCCMNWNPLNNVKFSELPQQAFYVGFYFLIWSAGTQWRQSLDEQRLFGCKFYLAVPLLSKRMRMKRPVRSLLGYRYVGGARGHTRSDSDSSGTGNYWKNELVATSKDCCIKA